MLIGNKKDMKFAFTKFFSNQKAGAMMGNGVFTLNGLPFN